MKNVEVANEYVGNALAYAKDSKLSEKNRLEVVISNLEFLAKLLKNPDDENMKYTWDDFK